MSCLILHQPTVSFFSSSKRLFKKKKTKKVTAPRYDESKPTMPTPMDVSLLIIESRNKERPSDFSHSTGIDSSVPYVVSRLNESLGLNLPITSDIAHSNSKRRSVRFADEKEGLSSSTNHLVTSISYRPITSKEDTKQLYYTELDYARFRLKEYSRKELEIAIHCERKDT